MPPSAVANHSADQQNGVITRFGTLSADSCRSEGPHLLVLWFVGVAAMLVGLIVYMIGHDRASSFFAGPDAGIGEMVLGAGLLGFGAWTLLIATACSAVLWQLRQPPRLDGTRKGG